MSTETILADELAAVDGLPAARRGWAAAAIFTALAMASLDTAFANIALPAIAADLHVGPADVIWVVNVYQIALVATLLPLAALGEIVGHRRIYLAGLVLFTVASLACACAWSLPSLLMARVLQGLGASGIMSVNTALVRFVYPGRLQGRGFGHNALVVATAFTLGPTIASGILAIGPWSWLFAINIPFGLVAIVIGLKTLPRTPRATHAFDFPGAVLAAGCLGLLILGIGSAAHHARPGLVLIELAAAVLLGWVLIRRQADHPAPVLPIDLFGRCAVHRHRGLLVAVQGWLSSPCRSTEDILGRSQVETGFFMTPWPLVVAMMAPIAGRLSNRYPAGILGGLGLALLGVGMALLAMLPASPHVADIVWRMAICGCGFGFFQAPNMKALRSSRPPQRKRRGIVAAARLTGHINGAALAALCLASPAVKEPRSHWCLARHSPQSDA
jgi:DHA2 family multidrug resistance protein-like MFS transporter